MKVVLFGGTGFMGYDFVRQLLDDGSFKPVVYCTSPSNLSNLARHNVDFRLAPYDTLPHLILDADTEVLVNFAHPFGARNHLSIGQQLRVLGDFLRRQLDKNPNLRLIHISSMSVYEPFGQAARFTELPLRAPPRRDVYAYGKYRMERMIFRTRSFSDRALVLRPTVVYGPFCRPWTDNLLAAFAAGDVMVHDPKGRIQPLLADDLSRFLVQRLGDFRPGIFNFAGPAEITWSEFFTYFERIVDRGRLVRGVSQSTNGDAALLPGLWDGGRRLFRQLLRDPRVKDLAMPVLRRLPSGIEGRVRTRFASPDYRNLSDTTGSSLHSPYCDPYYRRDRLISTRHLMETFPDVRLTDLATASTVIARYYEYRFTDDALV